MPRLIHVNGPSGIGKSTIARMYAERHPGVLNLDIDQVVGLIGGWQDDFWNAFRAAQLLAIGMAETHLRTGHDVVMPQLVTRHEDIAGFDAAVSRCGARYREIILVAEKQRALDRFAGRATSSDLALQRTLDEVLERHGGLALVERIHGQIGAYLRGRPDCVVVHTDGQDPAATYDAVSTALAEAPSGTA